MTVPTVSIVNSSLIELVEVRLSLAPSSTGVLEVGIVLLRSIAVVVVVTLLQSSESVNLQARDRFDIQRSANRTAEIVTILIRLFLVRTGNRVGLSRTTRNEITGSGGLVLNRICRVQRSSLFEIAAVVVVLIVHIREVVLELQPALQCLLVGSELGNNLLAVGVLGQTFCVLVVNGSTVVEVFRSTGQRDIMVGCNSSLLHGSCHPVGIILLTVRTGIENRFNLTA